VRDSGVSAVVEADGADAFADGDYVLFVLVLPGVLI